MMNYVRIQSIDNYGDPVKYEGFLHKIEAETYQGRDGEAKPVIYSVTLFNNKDSTYISEIIITDLKEIQIVEQ